MKNKKWRDSEILKILKEYESGVSAKELARQYGFYHQTLYDWKKKFDGVQSVQELARIRELEQENAKLKKMYANLALENEAIKDVLSKKW
jgi:putative transposase